MRNSEAIELISKQSILLEPDTYQNSNLSNPCIFAKIHAQFIINLGTRESGASELIPKQSILPEPDTYQNSNLSNRCIFVKIHAESVVNLGNSILLYPRDTARARSFIREEGGAKSGAKNAETRCHNVFIGNIAADAPRGTPCHPVPSVIREFLRRVAKNERIIRGNDPSFRLAATKKRGEFSRGEKPARRRRDARKNGEERITWGCGWSERDGAVSVAGCKTKRLGPTGGGDRDGGTGSVG